MAVHKGKESFIKEIESNLIQHRKEIVADHSHNKWSCGILMSVAMALLLLKLMSSECAGTVGILNMTVDYTCTNNEAITYQWFLNSTNISFFNVSHDIGRVGPVSVLVLEFVPLNLNNTLVECIATLQANRNKTIVQERLLVQGFLGLVGNLEHSVKDEILQLSWEPPFSLLHDNRTYCLDLYNNFNEAVIFSQCGLEATNYTFLPNISSINLICGNFSVSVLALNILGNGTPSTARIWNKELNVTNVDVFALNDKDKKLVYITMEQDICFPYTSLIIDGNEETIFPGNRSNALQFELQDDQIYHGKLIFQNQDLMSQTELIISTFDVSSTIVNPIEGQGVFLKSVFVGNSEAEGVLYVFIYIDHENVVDLTRSLFYYVTKEQASVGVQRNVSAGRYLILSYDIDEDLIFPRETSPAVIEYNFQLGESDFEESDLESFCDVNISDTVVCINCSCEENNVYHALLLDSDGTVGGVGKIMTNEANCSQSLLFNLRREYYYFLIVTDGVIYYSKVFNTSEEHTSNSSQLYNSYSTMVTRSSASRTKADTKVVIVVIFGWINVVLIFMVFSNWRILREYQLLVNGNELIVATYDETNQRHKDSNNKEPPGDDLNEVDCYRSLQQNFKQKFNRDAQQQNVHFIEFQSFEGVYRSSDFLDFLKQFKPMEHIHSATEIKRELLMNSSMIVKKKVNEGILERFMSNMDYQENTSILVASNAGVGKSHLVARLLKQDPSFLHISTPYALLAPLALEVHTSHSFHKLLMNEMCIEVQEESGYFLDLSACDESKFQISSSAISTSSHVHVHSDETTSFTYTTLSCNIDFLHKNFPSKLLVIGAVVANFSQDLADYPSRYFRREEAKSTRKGIRCNLSREQIPFRSKQGIEIMIICNHRYVKDISNEMRIQKKGQIKDIIEYLTDTNVYPDETDFRLIFAVNSLIQEKYSDSFGQRIIEEIMDEIEAPFASVSIIHYYNLELIQTKLPESRIVPILIKYALCCAGYHFQNDDVVKEELQHFDQLFCIFYFNEFPNLAYEEPQFLDFITKVVEDHAAMSIPTFVASIILTFKKFTKPVFINKDVLISISSTFDEALTNSGDGEYPIPCLLTALDASLQLKPIWLCSGSALENFTGCMDFVNSIRDHCLDFENAMEKVVLSIGSGLLQAKLSGTRKSSVISLLALHQLYFLKEIEILEDVFVTITYQNLGKSYEKKFLEFSEWKRSLLLPNKVSLFVLSIDETLIKRYECISGCSKEYGDKFNLTNTLIHLTEAINGDDSTCHMNNFIKQLEEMKGTFMKNMFTKKSCHYDLNAMITVVWYIGNGLLQAELLGIGKFLVIALLILPQSYLLKQVENPCQSCLLKQVQNPEDVSVTIAYQNYGKLFGENIPEFSGKLSMWLLNKVSRLSTSFANENLIKIYDLFSGGIICGDKFNLKNELMIPLTEAINGDDSTCSMNSFIKEFKGTFMKSYWYSKKNYHYKRNIHVDIELQILRAIANDLNDLLHLKLFDQSFSTILSLTDNKHIENYGNTNQIMIDLEEIVCRCQDLFTIFEETYCTEVSTDVECFTKDVEYVKVREKMTSNIFGNISNASAKMVAIRCRIGAIVNSLIACEKINEHQVMLVILSHDYLSRPSTLTGINDDSGSKKVTPGAVVPAEIGSLAVSAGSKISYGTLFKAYSSFPNLLRSNCLREFDNIQDMVTSITYEEMSICSKKLFKEFFSEFYIITCLAQVLNTKLLCSFSISFIEDILAQTLEFFDQSKSNLVLYERNLSTSTIYYQKSSHYGLLKKRNSLSTTSIDMYSDFVKHLNTLHHKVITFVIEGDRFTSFTNAFEKYFYEINSKNVSDQMNRNARSIVGFCSKVIKHLEICDNHVCTCIDKDIIKLFGDFFSSNSNKLSSQSLDSKFFSVNEEFDLCPFELMNEGKYVTYEEDEYYNLICELMKPHDLNVFRLIKEIAKTILIKKRTANEISRHFVQMQCSIGEDKNSVHVSLGKDLRIMSKIGKSKVLCNLYRLGNLNLMNFLLLLGLSKVHEHKYCCDKRNFNIVNHNFEQRICQYLIVSESAEMGYINKATDVSDNFAVYTKFLHAREKDIFIYEILIEPAGVTNRNLIEKGMFEMDRQWIALELYARECLISLLQYTLYLSLLHLLFNATEYESCLSCNEKFDNSAKELINLFILKYIVPKKAKESSLSLLLTLSEIVCLHPQLNEGYTEDSIIGNSAYVNLEDLDDPLSGERSQQNKSKKMIAKVCNSGISLEWKCAKQQDIEIYSIVLVLSNLSEAILTQRFKLEAMENLLLSYVWFIGVFLMPYLFITLSSFLFVSMTGIVSSIWSPSGPYHFYQNKNLVTTKDVEKFLPPLKIKDEYHYVCKTQILQALCSFRLEDTSYMYGDLTSHTGKKESATQDLPLNIF